jgi:hypothetical protein
MNLIMNTLKFTFFVFLLAATSVMFSACDSTSSMNDQVEILADRVTELPADPYTGVGTDGRPITAGKFTFYSLRTSSIVAASDSASTLWDLGFKGTTIIVNGGASGPGNGAAQIVNEVFSSVKTAPESGWAQDSASGYAIPAGSGIGWYNYNPANHAISAIPGRVLLVKTADGKYAKLSIVNYYKGLPEVPTATSESRFITFDFVFQPNGSRLFE